MQEFADTGEGLAVLEKGDAPPAAKAATPCVCIDHMVTANELTDEEEYQVCALRLRAWCSVLVAGCSSQRGVCWGPGEVASGGVVALPSHRGLCSVRCRPAARCAWCAASACRGYGRLAWRLRVGPLDTSAQLALTPCHRWGLPHCMLQPFAPRNPFGSEHTCTRVSQARAARRA